ncbi:MAG: HEPN domain-containing protein [Nitrospirae bacterium]|nr:HEPN domain-containing protein [Nitrospirota bacterium]MDA1302840.1 HEPN domain-containing protein [Nitrospirota bacterium]
MNKNPERTEIGLQWIKKAGNDLRNAEHTLTLQEDCPLDTVCFHAQQCVEKLLKAWLVFEGLDFPKTHDLTELVALLPDNTRFPISVDDCVKLTDYATVTRYPGEWEVIERSDAEQALELAKRVQEVVRTIFPG